MYLAVGDFASLNLRTTGLSGGPSTFGDRGGRICLAVRIFAFVDLRTNVLAPDVWKFEHVRIWSVLAEC